MPKRRLTEEGVAKLNPPADGQIDYYDAVMPGLVLRVNYGGAKAWRALYYINKTGKNGKRITTPTTYKLGRYPHLKLKEAREKARQFLADPQQALTKAETGSFRDVAENFIKRHVEHEKLRTPGRRSSAALRNTSIRTGSIGRSETSSAAMWRRCLIRSSTTTEHGRQTCVLPSSAN